MIREMRAFLAAAALFVALTTACSSLQEDQPAPLIDRSAGATASAAARAPTSNSTEASSNPEVSPAAASTYTVQSGDFLSRVAQDLGVSLSALSQANDIVDPTLIYPGQVLIVPGGATSPAGATTESPTPSGDPSAASASEATGGATEAATPRESLVRQALARLPFAPPTVIQEPLDELLAREGGEILAVGVAVAVVGVGLYIAVWILAALLQLIRLVVRMTARRARGGARATAAGTARNASRLVSLAAGAVATRFPRGQTLAGATATAGATGATAAPSSGFVDEGSSTAEPHIEAAPDLAPVPDPEAPSTTSLAVRVQESPLGRSGREFGVRVLGSWWRALRLDREFYREAGSVDEMRVQAVRVMVFSAIFGSMAWAGRGGALAVGAAALALLLGWVVETFATHVLATRGHYAPNKLDGLGRAFAFALAPLALLPLTLLPFVGVAAGLLVFGWVLAALVIATEQTLDLSLTESLESAVPGWLFLWVAPLVAVQVVS